MEGDFKVSNVHTRPSWLRRLTSDPLPRDGEVQPTSSCVPGKTELNKVIEQHFSSENEHTSSHPNPFAQPEIKTAQALVNAQHVLR